MVGVAVNARRVDFLDDDNRKLQIRGPTAATISAEGWSAVIRDKAEAGD